MEIFIFYGTFIVNGVYIFLNDFLLENTGLKYLEYKEQESDCLIRYKTMNGLYQTYSMMLYCTIYVIYRAVQDHYEKKNPTEVEMFGVFSLLAIVSIVHLLQFFALHVQLFADANSRGRHETIITTI